MLAAIVALQIIALALTALLLARRQATPGTGTDPRMAGMPDAILKLGVQLEAVDNALRNNVSELRYEQAKAAQDNRTAADKASRELREEINSSIDRLATTLNSGLAAFRIDNTAAADKLREAVGRDLTAIDERLTTFFAEAVRTNAEARNELHHTLTSLAGNNTVNNDTLREALQRSLSAIGVEQREAGERLRMTVESGLRTLNADNAAKLDEMRVVVDEKLQTTLNERLTASFGTVSDQLTRVHTGLGEMKELATGVSDLKKVFANPKSRGVKGEFLVGMQLEQMFSRDQYEVNIAIKANSLERVEYALKIPDGENGTVLLPIDSKFLQGDWERLDASYETGTLEEQAKLGAAFERAIRIEGKKICDKYIDPPRTLPFAIMFLPTEALYAEVMRRPGLHTELQNSCHITVAGPSSFMAILTSLQMGFRTLAIQKKGNEVWNVLGGVKKEFGKFELLMKRVETNVRTVQNTLGDIGVRTRAITKTLHDVSELNEPPAPSPSGLLAFDEVSGIVPLLAAVDEQEEPRG